MSTLLLTFANNQLEPLATLQQEYNEVTACLDKRQSKGHFTVRPIPFADKNNLAKTISQWKEDVELFLFSGHAGEKHLELLEGDAHSEGVAALLGLCPNLKLVVLNGCSTQGQVASLLDNGVPMVIATNAAINDEKATRFSTLFFKELTNNASIHGAYKVALAGAKLDGTIISEIGHRGVIRRDKVDKPIWGLYYQEAHKELIDTWRLPDKATTLLTRLPAPEDKVIGRAEEIKNLYDQLHQSKRVVLMNGMGGIGKTTTAMAYANQFKANYQRIVWIEQTDDFASAMTTNPVLNQHLGFTPSNAPIADTQLILNQLSNLSGKSLLVIDNATEEVARFKDYLPKPPAWQVLITSRQELGFAKKMTLGFLSPSAAMDLFYEHYKLDKNEEVVTSILNTLDYHTLTIELLAKVAQKRRIQPIQKIIDLLQERGLVIDRRIGLEVGHSKGAKIERLFPYLQAIFELGEITAAETHLLKQFIALPSSFIPLPLLKELLSPKESANKLRVVNSLKEKTPFFLKKLFGIKSRKKYKTTEELWDDTIDALDSLKEKGWLIYDDQRSEVLKEPTYKMHRVIQEVLQEKLKPAYEDIIAIIKNVISKLKIDETRDNPVEKFPYVPYGKRILTIIPDSEKADFAALQNNLALVLKDLGDYQGAKDLLEKAIKSDEQNLGKKHPTTASRYSNLGMVLKDLGDYLGAKDLLEKAMKLNKQNFGKNHFATAVSYSNLGIVLKDLGNYQGAKDLFEKAMKSNEQNFGQDHSYTARGYSNLSVILKELGDYHRAKDLQEKAIKSNEQNFGQNHPTTAVSYFNLGSILQYLGDYQRAKDLFEKAMKSDEKNFGQDHPTTAASYSNLGTVLKDLGDYQGAKDLFEKAMKSNEKNFGQDHPTTAASYSNLATVHISLKNYSFAKELLEKTIKSDEKNFGQDHPNMAITYSNLATVYFFLEDYSGAIKLLEKADIIFTLRFGIGHPHTKEVKKLLGKLS